MSPAMFSNFYYANFNPVPHTRAGYFAKRDANRLIEPTMLT